MYLSASALYVLNRLLFSLMGLNYLVFRELLCPGGESGLPALTCLRVGALSLAGKACTSGALQSLPSLRPKGENWLDFPK